MTQLTFTQAAARLHFSPTEFSRLRRTYLLPGTPGKGGPMFDERELVRWYERLPFCVRQSLSNRKPLATQACDKKSDRSYLMYLWGILRKITPPLGTLFPCFVLKRNHFTLIDHRGITQWRSLREAIDGMGIALALASTRSATMLKAA